MVDETCLPPTRGTGSQLHAGNAVLPAAAPCPWCGKSPDVTKDAHFQLTDGLKYGALQCCGTGPEVRTDYKPVAHWRLQAIEAWNDRPV